MNRLLGIVMVGLVNMGCQEEEAPPPTKTPFFEDIFSTEVVQFSGGLEAEIFLPPGFNDQQTYPIIYFNDGDGFRSVFNHLTFDYDEPFIMVGMHAGNKRTDLYTPYDDPWIDDNWGDYTPRAAAYSEQVVNEVLPYIENRYNIDQSRKGFFGMSLGGLHAAWIVMRYPNHFTFAGAMSPSFWVADYAIFNEEMDSVTRQNKFYFDIGTREWNYYVPLIQKLKESGLSYGRQIFYYEVDGGAHNASAWVERIHIPFNLFMRGLAGTSSPSFELHVECIPSLQTRGVYFQRLNPVISYAEGISYSLTTETSYEIVAGKGEVKDGVFRVSGTEMTVEVKYGNWSEKVTLKNCN
ncbi:MAG: alpha/beta hydrolase [Cyclobacteriaceae bacterium]